VVQSRPLCTFGLLATSLSSELTTAMVYCRCKSGRECSVSFAATSLTQALNLTKAVLGRTEAVYFLDLPTFAAVIAEVAMV